MMSIERRLTATLVGVLLVGLYSPPAISQTGGTAVYRINVAGGQFTDSQGRVWAADSNFSPSNTFSTVQPISGTVDDALYQKERYGNFSYQLPIQNGTYNVVLHFAEIWWNAAGQRVFDVTVEGAVALNDFDVWAEAGQFAALVRTVPVSVTDGALNVVFTSVVDSAKIAAIEVISTTGGGGTGTSPFQEQGGQVVMEAENSHATVARSGKSWSPQTTPAGFAGPSAMQSLPNSGTLIDTGYATTSAEMRFQVQFATAGTYHVWMRGFATTTNDNSIHVGLNGQPIASADRVELATLNAWAWTKNTMDGPVATLSVPAAGLHTINVWMREDGFYVDRLLLTTSSTLVPSGAGPAESPRTGGGATNQPPVVNAGPDQTITLPGSATLTGSATDDGLPNPPATLSYTWTKFGGPGTVTFANANAASTTASFSAAGTYTLRLTVSDSAATASDDVVITVNGGTSGPAPFQEQGGQVVVEAENFHATVARSGKSWSAQTTPTGFAGVSAMQSLPNSGTIADTGYATTSTEMQFQVQFATAGTYHVWMRGFATTTNDNSIHVGLNGQPIATADRVDLGTLNAWAWTKNTMDGPVATLSVPAAGLHTINVWMREDGLYVDRLLLTTSSTLAPSGTGPAESPRTGGGPTAPAAPTGLTATAGSSAIALAWNASAGATGYKVYRNTTSTVSTSGTPLSGTTPLTTTSYTDSTASAGVTYHYVVTAVNAAGTSPATAPVSAQLGSAITCATSSNPTLLNFSSTVAGTYGSTGFTCFMPGTVQPTGSGLTVSTASSHLAVASTDGDIYQGTNSLQNALALKFANSGTYTVRVRIKGPFGATVPWQAAGVFLALNADNYAKFVVGQGPDGARLEFAVETAAAFAVVVDVPFSLANLDQSSEALDLWLVRRSDGIIEALYRQVTNLTSAPVLGPVVSAGVVGTAPSWSVSSAELYGGLMTTDTGGGGSINTLFDEVELGPPPGTTSGPWTNELNLPIAVQEVAVAALNNKMYVAGGDTASGRVQTLYVFDPANPSWQALAAYPGVGRDHIGIAATGGYLYLIGGVTAWPQPSVTTVQRYDPAANTWTTMAPLPLARAAMGVAVLDGKIYAAGGLRNGAAVTDFTVYDPANNTWQTLPSMPTARDHLVGVAIDGKFYAIGGRPGGDAICSPVTTVQMYDPLTNAWSAKASMTTARGGHAAGTLNGKIQIFGGEGGASCGIIASAEEYNPATNSWAALASMPIARHGTGGATIGSKVYLPGGATNTGHQPTAAHQSFSQPPSATPPSAPTGLTATPGSSAIALTWNASSGATGYKVYRNTTSTVSTSGTPLSGTTPLTTTSYTDSTVSAGVTYHYVVTAVNAAGTSPATAPVSAQLGSAITCGTSSNPTLLNFSGTVAGTYGSSGFSCFMPNTVQPSGTGLTLSGFNSHLVVASTDGDIYQGTNTAQNALALKFANSGAYSVRVRIKGPFAATTPYQSAGVFLALNADNYAKFVVGQGPDGTRLEFAVETAAAFAVVVDVPFSLTNVDQSSEGLDLWLVRKSNGTVEALYRQITNLSGAPAFGPILSAGVTSTAPSWSVSSAELYGGLLTTDTGTGGSINTFFDEFQLGPSVSATSAPSPISFTTKAIAKQGASSGTAFGINGFDNPTSLELGPDGKLYVASQLGKLYVLTLDPQQLPTANGMAVTHVQTIDAIFNRTTLTCNIGGSPNNCQLVSGTPTGRQVTGLAIGPESTTQEIVLYVTHSDPRIGENNSSTAMAIDTWSGTITRLRLQPGTGGNYVVSSQEDLVVGLPRSRENHGVNGISFGPNGWMYFAVGGNTNYGKPSTFFSMLPEYYLSAAVLRLNLPALGSATLPLNVKGVTSAGGMAPFAGVLELFATGYRNAYDLVWHSNGHLYANDNAGNAGLGNTPDSGDGCSTPSINPGSLPDTLEDVTQGAYGGHPNPSHGECVLNAGNLYSPPLTPDADYSAPLLPYNQGASTNGIVEYVSGAFGGQLNGNLISATYAGNQNVRRVVLNSSGTGVIQEVNLGTFSQPLDVATDTAGIIYVAEHGADQVSVLIPEQTAATCPNSTTSDDDADGFTDADEAVHSTDPCSGASFPPDLDGDFVGNLSDPDLDGDNVANTTDQLNYDPQNGAGTALPVTFEWNPGDAPLGGISNTGFTGAQIASSGPRLNMNAIHVGAAGGFMTLDTSAGTAQGAANSQVNALQLGFPSTAPFTVSSRIVEPFNSTTAAPGHMGGIFFGPNQDNFLRLAIVGGTGGEKAVQLGFEQLGGFSEVARVSLGSGSVVMLDLELVADPASHTISAYYELNGSGTRVLVGDAANLPAAWFSNNQGSAAATSLAGLMTSHGGAAPTTFAYDFFRIQPLAFLEQTGEVVIEAELFHANISRVGRSWRTRTTPPGFVGGGAMQALPNTGTLNDTGYTVLSPEVQFQVQFTTPGTYHVWIRGFAGQANDSSVLVGVDGGPPVGADRVNLGALNGWAWTKTTTDGGVATVTIPTPGLHTINLWMHEDGFSIDRLLLTTSSTFVPSGAGPPQSGRVGVRRP